MAKSGNQALRNSLWDRLTASPGKESVAKPMAQSIRELVQSLRRDLQDLLNTRTRGVSWPSEFSELDDSLVNYGLPSFSRVENPRDLDALSHTIKATVERFEPRLRSVSVQAISSQNPLSRLLRFKIQGTLVVEPLDDRIAFTSTLEPVSGNFQVERAST